MADKYVAINTSGQFAEVVGTVTSTGVAEAGDLVALDATGKLDASVMPTGIGADIKVVVAGESMTAPAFVNLYDDAGTMKARYADASQANASRRAFGFIKDSVVADGTATVAVYFEGTCAGFVGLTGGSTYFLSNMTPGAVMATPPTTTGHSLQKVGEAISATEINAEIEAPVLRG